MLTTNLKHQRLLSQSVRYQRMLVSHEQGEPCKLTYVRDWYDLLIHSLQILAYGTSFRSYVDLSVLLCGLGIQPGSLYPRQVPGPHGVASP